MVHESTKRPSYSNALRRTPNICSSSEHSPQGQTNKEKEEKHMGAIRRAKTTNGQMGVDSSSLQTLALNGTLANKALSRFTA